MVFSMDRWNWIRRHLCLGTLLLTGAFVIAGALAGPALAHGNGGTHTGGGHNGGSGGSSTTGYDISWPQCGSTYPTGQAFGIVGVNGGLANDANSCLDSELSWAVASPGLTSPPQAPASLYINTADPGPTVSDWPSSNTTGYTNPYAPDCTSSVWSTGCAWVYGWDMGSYSFSVAALTATNKMTNVVANAPWWLDIETGNSWATSSTAGYTDLNIAAIQGFIAGLKDSGATGPIGVYSTGSQWNSITGLNSTSTGTYFGALPAWLAGARSLKQAKSNCAPTPSFTGQDPTLAQYFASGLDADLACT